MLKSLIFVCILLFLLFISFCGTNWVKVFEDQFKGSKLDTSNWSFSSHCRDHELQCYTVNRKNNIRVKNGKLLIIPRIEKWLNKSYTSVRINTKKSWTFGKFEVRARLPAGKHLWPAIWMMPAHYDYGEWAAGGEIDIMEYRGQRTNQILGTIHFGGIRPHNRRKGSKERTFDIDFSKTFNNFSIEWRPKSIKWFVNNHLYHKESLDRSFFTRGGPKIYKKVGQPFDKPFYLILNVAVGGNFFPKEVYGKLKTSEAKKWPKPIMEVDFVRVYKWIN